MVYGNVKRHELFANIIFKILYSQQNNNRFGITNKNKGNTDSCFGNVNFDN